MGDWLGFVGGGESRVLIEDETRVLTEDGSFDRGREFWAFTVFYVGGIQICSFFCSFSLVAPTPTGSSRGLGSTAGTDCYLQKSPPLAFPT